MKITKTQLRRIIKEEAERKLLQESASIATPMAMHMLNNITRSGGEREAAIAMMKGVFNQLGGSAAMESLAAAVDKMESEWQRRGSSWITK